MLPPKDNIYPILDKYLPPLNEGDILLITSKIVSIHQGRCVKIEAAGNKDDLIKKEADSYIDRVKCPGGYVVLTIKGHTLAASAGIDESNANGHYVFWPEKINETAAEICAYLKKKNKLKKMAVIITDSRSTPLRYGAVGVAIGFYGLEPLRDYRGTEDIFGRKLRMSRSNIVDSLSSAAVLVMGEGAEKIPLVIARGVKPVKFTNRHTYKDLIIPIKEDIYYPLLKEFYKREQK